jgi:triacylglycerol lipase
MKEQLKFAEAAVRVLPLGLKAVTASALRALEVKPSKVQSSCEPIVLMHGFAGFRELKLFDWTLIEYFTGVRRQLGAMGYKVFAPQVALFDDPHDRAKQWFGAIEKIREETGAEKVHLVGHSQGGLDARVLVAPVGPPQETPLGPLWGLGYGPHVASLTTVATPHLGSALANELNQEVPAHQDALDRLLDLLSVMAQLITGSQQDVKRAVKALSRDYMLDYFNRIIEDDPNVPYYAVAGDPISIDLVQPLLLPFYLAIREIDAAAGGGPNDGLVAVSSASFGNLLPAYEDEEYRDLGEHRRPKWKTLGIVQADHIAEVGLPLWFQPTDTYDHLPFFAGLVQFLDKSYTADMRLRKDGRWERTPKSGPVPVTVAA